MQIFLALPKVCLCCDPLYFVITYYHYYYIGDLCYFLSLGVGVSDELQVVLPDLLIQLIAGLCPCMIVHGWQFWHM